MGFKFRCANAVDIKASPTIKVSRMAVTSYLIIDAKRSVLRY